MSTLRVCEECSQPLPEDRSVGCPRCSFALALAPPRRFEPQAFGNYELLEETGSGSMGVVYRASQVALDRPVAIKMIKAGIFATEQQVRRFRSEARAAAKLQHPNVVRIFEVGEHDGRHFFSMDLVEGASLARLLAEGPLAPDRAARYLKAVAEAMAHAHQKGVFHRDLKPSNVLLDCFDQPRVTDFGLARHVELDSSQTATGEVLGTPSFMPPEQALGQNRGAGGSDDPARSDVYSMGATLYALVCGRPPFHGKTAVETLRRVIDLEPTAPRQLNPSVPRDLETICLTCLSKDPAGRYASAKELADDLGRFLARQPILAQRPGPAGRLVLWTKRNPAAAVTSGLGAVLGVLVLLGTLSLRADQLDGNRYSAEHVAPSVLQRFQGWGSLLVSAAESEPLRRALGSADQPSLEQFAATTRAAAGTAFESVIVLDENGKVLARDPPMPSMVGRSFERRDYFRGASRQRGQHGLVVRPGAPRGPSCPRPACQRHQGDRGVLAGRSCTEIDGLGPIRRVHRCGGACQGTSRTYS